MTQPAAASWFETRGVAALENAPEPHPCATAPPLSLEEHALACVSKDEATAL
jgi:hypothetical protein